uniref:Uncharacterized protein n=1 Tax=Timema genevievae TaxID=629358 RepID=A0A7R9JNH9_TIMGE|nr:unnamed protein product [Timema genevievae]
MTATTTHSMIQGTSPNFSTVTHNLRRAGGSRSSPARPYILEEDADYQHAYQSGKVHQGEEPAPEMRRYAKHGETEELSARRCGAPQHRVHNAPGEKSHEEQGQHPRKLPDGLASAVRARKLGEYGRVEEGRLASNAAVVSELCGHADPSPRLGSLWRQPRFIHWIRGYAHTPARDFGLLEVIFASHVCKHREDLILKNKPMTTQLPNGSQTVPSNMISIVEHGHYPRWSGWESLAGRVRALLRMDEEGKLGQEESPGGRWVLPVPLPPVSPPSCRNFRELLFYLFAIWTLDIFGGSTIKKESGSSGDGSARGSTCPRPPAHSGTDLTLGRGHHTRNTASYTKPRVSSCAMTAR